MVALKSIIKAVDIHVWLRDNKLNQVIWDLMSEAHACEKNTAMLFIDKVSALMLIIPGIWDAVNQK